MLLAELTIFGFDPQTALASAGGLGAVLAAIWKLWPQISRLFSGVSNADPAPQNLSAVEYNNKILTTIETAPDNVKLHCLSEGLDELESLRYHRDWLEQQVSSK